MEVEERNRPDGRDGDDLDWRRMLLRMASTGVLRSDSVGYSRTGQDRRIKRREGVEEKEKKSSRREE